MQNNAYEQKNMCVRIRSGRKGQRYKKHIESWVELMHMNRKYICPDQIRTQGTKI